MWRMGAANHDTWLWGIDLLMYFVLFCDKSCKSMRVAKPTKMPDRVPSLHADATTHFAEVKLSKIAFFPFTPFSGSQPVGTSSHKKPEKTEKKRSSPSHYGLKIHHPPGPTQLHQLNSSISSLSSHQRLSCGSRVLNHKTRKSPKKSPPLDPPRLTSNKQPFLRWSRRCSSFSNVPQWPSQLCPLAKTTKQGKTIVTISDHRITEGNFLGNFRG